MVKRPPHLYGYSYLKDLPKEELDRFIILCRYMNQRDRIPTHACMTLANIAKLVGRSVSYCQRVAVEFLKKQARRFEYQPIVSRSKHKAALEKKRKSWELSPE